MGSLHSGKLFFSVVFRSGDVWERVRAFLSRYIKHTRCVRVHFAHEYIYIETQTHVHCLTSLTHTRAQHRLNCIFIYGVTHWGLDFLVHVRNVCRPYSVYTRYMVAGCYDGVSAVCDYDRSSRHGWALQSPSLALSAIAWAHFDVNVYRFVSIIYFWFALA